MAQRIWLFVNKTDDQEIIVVLGEQAEAEAQAEAQLGIANYSTRDVTSFLLADLGKLVGSARDRVPSADGSGRWRYRTTDDAVKAWLQDLPTLLCPACDQPTTDDRTLAIREMLGEHRVQIEGLEARLIELQNALAALTT